MAELICRKLEESDATAMSALEKVCFSDPWSDGMIHNSLTGEFETYYGLFDGDRLVAYAGMYVVFEDADITNVAVDPDYRRAGLGAKLLEILVELARISNCADIGLEVRKSNLPAIALYRKFGFKEVGIRPNYYENPREDAILMTLELN